MTTSTEDLLAEVRLAQSLPPAHEARRVRVAASISQARLAEVLGVDRATLSRWETGASRPRGAQRVAYADLLARLRRELAA